VARGKIVVSEIKRKPSHTTTRTRGEIVLGFFAKVRLISFFAGLRVCGPLKKRKERMCHNTHATKKKQRPVVTTLFFKTKKKNATYRSLSVPRRQLAQQRTRREEDKRFHRPPSRVGWSRMFEVVLRRIVRQRFFIRAR